MKSWGIWRSGATAVMVALPLCACAVVPTSGPVQQGPAIAVAADDQFIRVIARPPRPGMTPDEIVRGFLEASSSADGGYGVARDYLTATASSGWDPTAGVRVYDNSGVETTTGIRTVSISGVLDGFIAPDSGYVVAPAGRRLAVTYGITKVLDQWRISALPDGLVLARGDVERGFRTLDVYFLDPSFSVLAPDPVTFPVAGSGLATVLVRSLLKGPTSWLAPAVRTAFPEGTTLALDSVPVDGGVAQVDLSRNVLAADDSTRQALSAQLIWTLRQLPDVTGVRITVSGQPFLVAGAGAIQSTEAWPTYTPNVLPPDPSLVMVGKSGLVRVTAAGESSALAGGFGKGQPSLVSPALALDGSLVAGIASDRRSLWTQSLVGVDAPARRLLGADLSRPSFDRTGIIWVVDRGRGVRAISGGKALDVPVAALPVGVNQGDLISIAVARDGTRAALLLRRTGRVEPWVARVEREGDVLRLSAPRRVESTVVEARDIGWQDADRLAVLGSDGASPAEVFLVDPGFGRVRSQGGPVGPRSLAAGPGLATVVGSGDTLFTSVNGSWTPLKAGSDPAYPG